MKYCEAAHQTIRRKTSTVMVGNIGVGGDNPIRIQSMTTSNTRDVEATIEQAMRLFDAGCEIVRVTVQGMKEAEACEGIKSGLIAKGYNVPIVADIHFFPPAALRVVDFVDKVRINPGNFVDKRASFKVIEYDDASYAGELEKIEEKFAPLVEKCKKLKRSMRIGTNHGSLSDRIMNRYGDTPQGMVESAIEFAEVCRKYDYHDIIFSMKASNPQVMIQAYRLLVARMNLLGWDYPLHLGVTEAGDGEDGRVKSAIGIGSLLLDGIGDTIRVSLTEDPWLEIDPCKRLIQFATQAQNRGIKPFDESFRKIDEIKRREITLPKNVSWHRDGTVFVQVDEGDLQRPDFFRMLGCDQVLGRAKISRSSSDNIILLDKPKEPSSYQVLKQLQEIGIGIVSPHSIPGAIRLLTLEQAILEKMKEPYELLKEEKQPFAISLGDEPEEKWSQLTQLEPAYLVFKTTKSRLHQARLFFNKLQLLGVKIPVVLYFSYEGPYDETVIHASAELGALFCDGYGEGICLEAAFALETRRLLSFNILQASRMRSSKTDFISCPSCGRTLFDLQDVTRRIRSRTAHLAGVKIAIMGCIVNGPGEMADADFGYVGSKPGKIDLYVGKKCVEKDIDFAKADDRLVELIKSHDRWTEPV